MNTTKEFEKIRRAFEKVKEENIFLNKKIEELEKFKEDILRYLLERKDVTTRVEEKEKVYIGNKESGKVHVDSCPYGKKISPENRVIFNNINDALREKFVRCSCVTY